MSWRPLSRVRWIGSELEPDHASGGRLLRAPSGGEVADEPEAEPPAGEGFARIEARPRVGDLDAEPVVL